MADKHTISETPGPTVEQQNKAWRDFYDDIFRRMGYPFLDMSVASGES